MRNVVVVVLLLAVFALGGALYATAAPTSVPGQIYSLKVKVKDLRLRMDQLESQLSDTRQQLSLARCSANATRASLGELKAALRAGKPVPEDPIDLVCVIGQPK